MPDSGTEFSRARLAPSEAISYFRQKVNIPTERWGELSSAAHATGFAVAGATSEALLKDFRKAIGRALTDGTTLKEFRQQFDSIVKKRGWQHTGSPGWRARIIYQTNMASAHAAGRYYRLNLPEARELFPQWMYLHHSCPHPRPLHLAWSGTILPNDDPWWATHSPPNGWGCHCGIEPVSDAKMARRGWSVSEAPPIEMRDWRNPATGRIEKVPKGIDPGFQSNPGMEWMRAEKRNADMAMTPVTKAAGRPIRDLPLAEQQAIQKHELAKFVDVSEGPTLKPVGMVEAGTLHPQIRRLLGSASDRVLLSAENLQKNMDHHDDLLREDYEALPYLLSNPDYAIATGKDTQLVLLVEHQEKIFKIAVKTTQTRDENFLMSVLKKSRKDLPQILRNKEVVYRRSGM